MDDYMNDNWNKTLQEEAAQSLNNFSAALKQIVLDISASLLTILRKLKDIFQITEKKTRAERPKWKLAKPLKPRFLYLDKRTKIHRCRNHCRKYSKQIIGNQ